MSVHYKFKSALEYDTVTFDGLHISVKDLKNAIVQQKRIGKNTDFDLQVTNAQTKEVYEDDHVLIPKNTSLLIARIPTSITSKNKQWEGYGGDNTPPAKTDEGGPIAKAVDLSSLDAPEDDKIKAMMSQSTQDYDPSNYMKIRGANQMGTVPPNYRCYKCHQMGHWIKDCPLSKGPEPIEIKKSTGIPLSFMVPVEGPQVQGAMMTPNGSYAVPVLDHQTYTQKQHAAPPPMQDLKPEIPEDLLCSICSDLLSDAVMIPCCGNSFCDECIRSFLLESEDHECPDCHEKDISPGTLIPNRFLRNSVATFKNTTGYVKRPVYKQRRHALEENSVKIQKNEPENTILEVKSDNVDEKPVISEADSTESRNEEKEDTKIQKKLEGMTEGPPGVSPEESPKGQTISKCINPSRERPKPHKRVRDDSPRKHHLSHHSPQYPRNEDRPGTPTVDEPGVNTPNPQVSNQQIYPEPRAPPVYPPNNIPPIMPPIQAPPPPYQQPMGGYPPNNGPPPNFRLPPPGSAPPPYMQPGPYQVPPRPMYDAPRPPMTGPPPIYNPQFVAGRPHHHKEFIVDRRVRGRTPSGVIDDPLAAFNRMLREKDERERRAKRNLRRSYSRSRSRSRSYSRSPRRLRSRTPRRRSRSFSISRHRFKPHPPDRFREHEHDREYGREERAYSRDRDHHRRDERDRDRERERERERTRERDVPIGGGGGVRDYGGGVYYDSNYDDRGGVRNNKAPPPAWVPPMVQQRPPAPPQQIDPYYVQPQEMAPHPYPPNRYPPIRDYPAMPPSQQFPPVRRYEDVAPPGVEEPPVPGMENSPRPLEKIERVPTPEEKKPEKKEKEPEREVVVVKDRERDRKRKHDEKKKSPSRRSKTRDRESPEKSKKKKTREISAERDKDRDIGKRNQSDEDKISKKSKDKKKKKDKKDSDKKKRKEKKEKHKDKDKERNKHKDDTSGKDKDKDKDKEERQIIDFMKSAEKPPPEPSSGPLQDKPPLQEPPEASQEEEMLKTPKIHDNIPETIVENVVEPILVNLAPQEDIEAEEKDILDLHPTDLDLKTELDNKNELSAILPEKSKWEVEEDSGTLQSSQNSQSPKEFSDKSGAKVTNEVLKRAENAIFAKAINAIRPIEIKKISTDRAKLYSGEAEEIEPVIEDVVLEEKIQEKKKVEAPVVPQRIPIKDRLGIKIEEDKECRNKSRSISPFSRRTESSSRNLGIGERRVELVERERERGQRNDRRHRERSRHEIMRPHSIRERSNRRDRDRDRERNREEARRQMNKTPPRHDDKNRRKDEKKREPTKHPKIEEIKRRLSQSKSDSEEKRRNRKKDKKGKKEKTKPKEEEKSKEDRDPKPEETKTAATAPPKSSSNPENKIEKKKPTIDEASFEPDYDLESESDKDDNIMKTAVKKPAVPEGKTGKSSSSSGSTESSSDDDRKKKKHRKHSKKKRSRKDSSSSNSDSDSDSSDDEKDRKKRKHKRSKKKKKKSKHK